MSSSKLFLNLALSIPFVNILMDMLMILIPEIKIQIAVLRTSILLVIILIYLIYFGLEKTKLNVFLMFYFFYLLILTLLTSDLSESLIDGFLKMFVSIMMIPIGIKIGKFKGVNFIKPLNIVLFIFIINYIISQIFKVGFSVYHEDSFYLGGASVTAPIIIAIVLLVLVNGFNTNRLKSSKIIATLMISIGVFIILISLKRGAIISFIIGVMSYLMVSPRKIKTSFRFFIILFGLLIISSQFIETLQNRIDSRTTERNQIQNENRYKETFYVFEEIENSNIVNILFGNEAFNSKVVMKKHFGRERQLHVDYNILLHGTGIIGIILYFFIFYFLYKNAIKIKRKSKHLKDLNYKLLIGENFALLFSLIVLSFIMSFSGGVQFTSYRVILFLTMGFYLGQMMRFRDEKALDLAENKLKV